MFYQKRIFEMQTRKMQTLPINTELFGAFSPSRRAVQINSTFEQELSVFLYEEIDAALGNHLGGIEVESISGLNVNLRLLASCSRCYFRQACIENLVMSELKRKFGDKYKFSVK